MAQRQGIFTENIVGRVPAIYDPSTTAPAGSRARSSRATRFRSDRMDPVALALLLRYPEPTSAGTANNYRRTASEIDDQNQWDVRLDHQFASGSDRVFGRLSNFRGRLRAGDAAAGRQRHDDRHARSAGHHVVGVRLELSAHVLEQSAERAAHRRHAAHGASDRRAAVDVGGLGAQHARHSLDGAVPEHAADVHDRRLSDPRIADRTRRRTSTPASSEVADTLTWVKGRHTFKAGFDWRWERLNVIQPPSPTGSFTFNQLGSDLPGTANTGAPLASFLLGQVQTFSIDLQNVRDPGARQLPGVLRSGRLEGDRAG